MPSSLLYNLKYSILVSSGSFKEALKGIDKAILLYPDYVDLHFYKAVSLYHEGMFNECILTLEHCLSLGDEPCIFNDVWYRIIPFFILSSIMF